MRKPRKNLTPSQRSLVARLYADGFPIKVIAYRFGIHRTGVCLIAKALGVPPRNVFSKRNHVSKKSGGEFGAQTPYQPGVQSLGAQSSEKEG